jgi:hypothetical protein
MAEMVEVDITDGKGHGSGRDGGSSSRDGGGSIAEGMLVRK